MSYPSFFDNAITLEPTIASSQEACLYELKELLKLAGWTVLSSGDGISDYDSADDVITTSSSGANGMGNDNAWYRIQAPASASYPSGTGPCELTVQVIVAGTNPEVRMKTNNLGRADLSFTGGSPDFETTPRISTLDDTNDAWIMLGGGTDAAPTGQGWWHSSTVQASARALGVAESVFPYRFWFSSNSSVSPYPKGANLCLDAPELVDPDDVDIYVVWRSYSLLNGGWDASNYETYSGGSGILAGWLDADRQRLTAQSYGTPGGQIPLHPVTGAYVAYPVFIVRDDGQSTPNGPKGLSTVLRRFIAPPGGDVPSENTQFDSPDGDRRWLMANDYTLPWPSGSTLTHFTNPWNSEDIVAFTAVPQDSAGSQSNPPQIGNFSPALVDGVQKNQALAFDITDDTGLVNVVILVSFSDGSVEIVHDGFEFRDKYRGDSNSRSVISSGYRYVIKRDLGWLSSPTVEFIAIDNSGNIGELL